MIETVSQLRRYLPLTDREAEDIERVGRVYPWRITPYYAGLMDPNDPACPIRRQAVPDPRELEPWGAADPLEEERNAPVHGVIRVYPDRIAVVVTSRCPAYCRHCLRKRFRRDEADDLRGERLDRVLSYIRRDTSIRDVLLTGGDPLMLPDAALESVLWELRSIPHVEIIRVGTRAPCTWPGRVTDALADMLASYHPLWMSTQFNHPLEITPEAERSVDILLRRGIPVNNQSVFLRGVNDSVGVFLELVRKLVRIRVRPYYVYQAQTLSGTGHFVTTIEEGLAIMQGLRGWTTGFAVPQYVLDTPYGKIPLNPPYLRGRHGDFFEMESWSGKMWREWNPAGGRGL
jgi:lysine 2,3-aminomutase